MPLTRLQANLPGLAWRTPARWAQEALRDSLALLSDHAYLERKAASNVLELFNRWPEPGTAEGWSTTLAGIAKDEAQHLQSVMRLLERRGGKLQRLHKSTYANDLRQLVRVGKGKQELLDRLLVSALIEARSCERFEILADHCPDKELAQFYGSLCASEAGHYAVFLKLGARVLPSDDVRVRWEQMLKKEAEIIQSQPPGPCIHSGLQCS
jgi:tRNA 2-(methylsulfanyl)-N6-isopentenyladenosine37 hydroxylase